MSGWYVELTGSWWGCGRSWWCRLTHHRSVHSRVLSLQDDWRDVVWCSVCDQYDVPRWGSRTQGLTR